MPDASRLKTDRSRVRVLAIHRYYWPDSPPYASLLRVIAEHWSSAGHDVRVLTSQPSYKPEQGLAAVPTTETIGGVVVRRIGMKPDRSGPGRKFLNLVRFPVLVFLRVLLGPRQDVVMCSTAPPVVLGAMVAWAARLRGARFVYHCMDLHPEIGALSGEFSNPALFRLLRSLDTRTCRRAAAVVVLSTDMRDVLIERAPDLADSIVVINNFEIPSFDLSTSTVELPARSGRLRIVFAGNIGRYQGLETITSALLVDDPRLDDVELVFMGEGSAKSELKGLVASAPEAAQQRVRFLPHSTVSDAKELLGTADVGLVSLSPGVISYAYPSKTATYLAAGLPLLVAVEPESCLAHEVQTWGVGAVLSTETIHSAKECLVHLLGQGEELTQMRDRTEAAWREHFATETLLPRWDELLDRVGNARSHA